MRGRGWAAAIALVVAVNGVVLARVAANRSGEPDASLTLTERELPIVSVSPRSESSGVALRLDVQHWVPWTGGPARDFELDPLRWLDAGKLAALGFDVSLPRDADEAELFVARQLPRRAYAVLEMEGSAWEAYRGRITKRFALTERDLDVAPPLPASDRTERGFARSELRFGSRLFVVDVGADAEALRRQYPDRAAYVIAPAKVRAHLVRDRSSPECPSSCRVSGSVSLAIDELSVPRRLQRSLPAQRDRAWYGAPGEHGPRYEVVLRSGTRHEPWIEEIRPVAGAR
jgi:hypothetical protein